MFTLNNTKWRQWLFISLLILVVDQVSKALIIVKLGIFNTVAIMPSLNFSLAYNKGAAFGMLADSSGWQKWLFSIIAIVMSLVIIFWSARLSNKDSAEGVALACILAGALGNLLDRLRYGYVIDFIDFYIHNWHWYTFNVADIAICLGSTILLWLAISRR